MNALWPFGEIERGIHTAVVADCPWNMKTNSIAKPGRNPRRHYPTMLPQELAALPVRELGAKDCALFLWITGPFLAIGAHIPIMRAWGFKPSGIAFTWVKLNKRAGELFFMKSDLATGTGFTTRKNTEICLIGKRGHSVRRDMMVHEVIIAPRREHSRKPVEARQRIEKYLGPGARIVELFAREPWPGQEVWGDQADYFGKAA